MSQEITPRQWQAVELLASGMSAGEVAERVQVTRETISRWKAEPHIRQRIDEVVQETRERLRYRLIELVDASVAAITKGINACSEGPRNAVNALNTLK